MDILIYNLVSHTIRIGNFQADLADTSASSYSLVPAKTCKNVCILVYPSISNEYCSDSIYQLQDKTSNCGDSILAKFNNYRTYGIPNKKVFDFGNNMTGRYSTLKSVHTCHGEKSDQRHRHRIPRWDTQCTWTCHP